MGRPLILPASEILIRLVRHRTGKSMSMSHLLSVLNMSKATWYHRIKRGGPPLREENVRQLLKILNITASELAWQLGCAKDMTYEAWAVAVVEERVDPVNLCVEALNSEFKRLSD